MWVSIHAGVVKYVEMPFAGTVVVFITKCCIVGWVGHTDTHLASHPIMESSPSLVTFSRIITVPDLVLFTVTANLSIVSLNMSLMLNPVAFYQVCTIVLCFCIMVVALQ